VVKRAKGTRATEKLNLERPHLVRNIRAFYRTRTLLSETQEPNIQMLLLQQLSLLLFMSLEEDILQPKFNSEYDKAVVNILFTGSWLYNLNASRFKPYDITPEQYNVLRILRGSHPKPMMLADITSRMIDKSSNATRLVEKLRAKGFLKREICEDNRRQVDIFITEKGLSVLKKIDQESAEWLSKLKSISKAEAAELNRILDKLRG
jgi:DNA-binding MarR family transcriptional regulator